LSEITDSAWIRVAYDISGYADNQTNVFIRWSHQVAQNGAFAYSGWNIDDLEFLGVTSVDHFAWAHLSSPQVTRVPFAVSLQAQNSTNGVVTGFSGTVTLSDTNGASSISPLVTGNFVQGNWTGSVLAIPATPSLVLMADDGQGHTGVANPIALVSAPTLEMAWDGTTFSIRWPAGAPALVLESSDSLSPSSWVPVPGAPVQIGEQYVVPIAFSDPQRFYRLRYSTP
jgi:hypothetical protein